MFFIKVMITFLAPDHAKSIGSFPFCPRAHLSLTLFKLLYRKVQIKRKIKKKNTDPTLKVLRILLKKRASWH